MARFVVFLLLLIPLLHAGLWLAENPGSFNVSWLGYDVQISMGLLAFSVAVLLLLAMLIGMVLWALSSWPNRRKSRLALKHQQQGLQQLTLALIAAGQNDMQPAQLAIARASNLLPNSPLPHLIGMQLSNREANPAQRSAHLAALTQHVATARMALQQSLRDAIKSGDIMASEKLLHEAQQRYPREEWLIEAKLRIGLQRDDLQPIMQELSGIHLRYNMPRSKRKTLLARLYYLANKNHDALRYDSNFIPAACREAGNNNGKSALKILRPAWRNKPAAPLLAAWLQATAGMNVKAQNRSARRFAAWAYPHAEAEDILASNALRQNQLDNALQHAKRGMELNLTKQRLSKIAEIVTLRDRAEAASGWLKEAVTAQHNEGWYCNICTTSHADWQIICRHCDSIDSINWQSSNASAVEILQ